MVSERDVERQGLSVGPAPAVKYEECTIGVTSPNGPRTVRVPKGIDPGFEYTPGQSRLSSAVPPLRACPLARAQYPLQLSPGRRPAQPSPTGTATNAAPG